MFELPFAFSSPEWGNEMLDAKPFIDIITEYRYNNEDVLV
jgi:hypothetical protein